MAHNSINTLLCKAISNIQRVEKAKSKRPSIAVIFDKLVVDEAVQSGEPFSIKLAAESATALHHNIIEKTPAFIDELMAMKPFDEIRKEFLLPDGSLDNERLLAASKELPSE